MSKEYFLLHNGKVVYRPGHYDIEGARAVLKHIREKHPRAKLTIVKIVETYCAIPKPSKG
jgi:hypothetical protein